uniref:Putative secreted protein n=1 Tax=Anopheles triannulatus TaxID=58253 RepID=A0A2M4B6W8_9DIPT
MMADRAFRAPSALLVACSTWLLKLSLRSIITPIYLILSCDCTSRSSILIDIVWTARKPLTSSISVL